MRHRRALELPLDESTAAPEPRPARTGASIRRLTPPARRSCRCGQHGSRGAVVGRAPGGIAFLRLHNRISSGLVVCAQRFTPRVSLDPPDGLLLEVKGSLHLFGGVAGLSREMAGECSRLRMPGTLAVAPTPLAALALARAGRRRGGLARCWSSRTRGSSWGSCRRCRSRCCAGRRTRWIALRALGYGPSVRRCGCRGRGSRGASVPRSCRHSTGWWGAPRLQG